MNSDPFNLQRFVDAQETEYARVCSELRSGHKSGHWMWFIFPQVKGLGRSVTSEWFGIGSLEEAQAYIDHAMLGPRLRECVQLVLTAKVKTINQIFGFPDNRKFISCMTLFAHVTSENSPFVLALQKYNCGQQDAATIQRIR